MERKRIKGRFAAEDKGGVVKKQVEAPTAEPPRAIPRHRAESLIGSLLDRWKQRSQRDAAK